MGDPRTPERAEVISSGAGATSGTTSRSASQPLIAWTVGLASTSWGSSRSYQAATLDQRHSRWPAVDISEDGKPVAPRAPVIACRTESSERPTRSAMSRIVSSGSASTCRTCRPGALSSTCPTTSMIAAARVVPAHEQDALPRRSAERISSFDWWRVGP